MGLLADLPDVLSAGGCDVHVMPGAATRTTRRRGLEVRGIIWHHTATSKAWADGHVAALLRDGRRDLAGPLTQLGLERDGTFVVVACGRANHDGYGRWGNDSIGIEIYNSGLGETYPATQLEALDRGTVALCRAYGLDPNAHLLAHRESAGHKIDPTGIAMPPARARIAARLDDQEHDDMTPTQENKLDAIVMLATAAADGVAALAERVAAIEAQQVPKVTAREGLRNIKRIGTHLDVEGIEGLPVVP